MRCPYCASSIDDAALACPHCTRDLYLFKPLLARIEAQDAAIASLTARLEDLGGRLVGAQPDAVPADGDPVEGRADADALLPALARYWAVPLGLLLLAHALVIGLYDARPVWLHVLALLIPGPFGYALVRGTGRRPGPWIAAAVLLALAAVLGMSTLTAALDGAPVLPASPRDWREFLEFAASIALSYGAGLALGRRIPAWRATGGSRAIAAEGLDGLGGTIDAHLRRAARMEEAARRMHRMVNSLVALGAALAAAYTGLKNVVGD